MSEVGNAFREAAVPEISYFSDTYTITSGMALTITHGLAKTPRQIWLRIKCLTAELGYAVGDEVNIATFAVASGTNGVSIGVNNSQIKVVLETLPAVINFSSQAATVITAANWNLVVKAQI